MTLLPLLTLALASLVSAKLVLDCDTSGGSNGSDITWSMSNAYANQQGADQGWIMLPQGPDQVCGADLKRIKVGSKGATVPLYVSNDTIDDEVLRAVLVFPPRDRSVWDYFTQVRNARQRAEAQFAGLDANKTAIIGLQLLTTADLKAGAAISTDVVWGGNSWMYGGHAAGPSYAAPHHTSSFDVIDETIGWIKKRYPKLERIVAGGHSAGAQLGNRYSVMTSRNDGDSVHYFIANPSSYVWMNSDRPVAPVNCPQYDDYKYGLNGTMSIYMKEQFSANGRTGLMTRLAERSVSILVGKDDNGEGDTGCQAQTQGPTHRKRGQNYIKSIKSINGDLPSAWTWDQVPQCSHDSNCMFNSYLGQQRMFYDGYPGATKPWARREAEEENIVFWSREERA